LDGLNLLKREKREKRRYYCTGKRVSYSTRSPWGETFLVKEGKRRKRGVYVHLVEGREFKEESRPWTQNNAFTEKSWRREQKVSSCSGRGVSGLYNANLYSHFKRRDSRGH